MRRTGSRGGLHVLVGLHFQKRLVSGDDKSGDGGNSSFQELVIIGVRADRSHKGPAKGVGFRVVGNPTIAKSRAVLLERVNYDD